MIKIIHVLLLALLLSGCASQHSLLTFDDYGYDSQKPEDCFEGEQYDAETQTCFYECETEMECAAIEAKIQQQLEEIGQEYFDGEKTLDPKEAEEFEEESMLVIYKVKNGALADAKNQTVKAELQKYQQDKKAHQNIWNIFKKMASDEIIDQYIIAFEVVTDGKDGGLAYVYRSEIDPAKWILGVDVQDAENKKSLYYSLLHEFAHILTLNQNQIEPDAELATIDRKDSPLSEDDVVDLMVRKEESCKTFFVREGCTYENSYLNQFYIQFWQNIYDEWEWVQGQENDDKFYEESERFYAKHKDKFITDYAATNPGEDFAETFVYFITRRKPVNSKSIPDQKVLFMYRFPELIKMREEIRQRLTGDGILTR